MALKDSWIDKVNGQDMIDANDINSIANAVIDIEENGAGGGGVTVETDPTVPAWAKASTKPTYTASEVGALPSDTVIPTVPRNVSAFDNDAGYLTEGEATAEINTALTEAKASGEFDGADGYTPVKGVDYFTAVDKAEIEGEIVENLITQNTGDSTELVMSQNAVTSALKTITTLPYGGSKEWLENNGDKTKLYQIDGYVWGYIESDDWTKSDVQFLVVSNENEMTNTGGTPYLLRSGNTGTVYSYTEASGDIGIPVYDSLPETANEGDIIAVGNRKHKASLTTQTVPAFENKADFEDTSDNNWKTGYRLNSSGVSTASTGTPAPMVTNYVGCKTGDVIRVKGLTLGDYNVAVYKDNKVISNASKPTFPMTSAVYDAEVESTDVYKFTLKSDTAVFIRFSGVPVGATNDIIITVNEPITYHTETTVTWTDIGAYTPPVEAGWSATDETYSVIDSLSVTAESGTSAVYSVDGYLYTYINGSDWMQISKYNAPTLSIDGELSDVSANAIQNKVVTEAFNEVNAKIKTNADNITGIDERVTELETDSDILTIPSFWQTAVNDCIAGIKEAQVGKNCVTFPFFSDNHTRDKNPQYMGIMIAHIMKECGIPYCFCGGDAITSAIASTPDSDAEFKAQARAFKTAMSYIPDGRFCIALGNHEGYLKANSNIEGSTTVRYDRNQTYEIFIRDIGTAQNKHFGVDGTYYYVDDIVSKVRWVILNTNNPITGGESSIDAEQREWIFDTALKFNENGWGVVFISHIPITNHYNAHINEDDVEALIEGIEAYIATSYENKADIIGWYSGHIHRDRIFSGLSVDNDSDTEGEAIPFKQVTINSDHTTISYDDTTKHTIGNDAYSHAIDFVTINKDTTTVTINRLGMYYSIDENGDEIRVRSYTY